MQPTLAAYFYPTVRNAQGGKGVYELHSLRMGERHPCLSVEPCKSRKEARELAKDDGATPWNF